MSSLYLFYCSSVWSNTTESNLRKLQAVQNFAARIITHTRKYEHITPVLKELRWFPVNLQLYYRDALTTFKCLTGRAPVYLTAKFTKRSNISKRVTRNSQKLNIPLFRTASGQRTFCYRAVSLWNDLEPSLKACNSVQNFKQLFIMIRFTC